MKLSFKEEELISLLTSYYHDREGRNVSIKIGKSVDRQTGKVNITYNAHEDITVNNVSASLDYEISLEEVKSILRTILSELGYEVLNISEDKKVEQVCTGYYTSYTTLNPVFNGIVVGINQNKKQKKIN